DSLVGAAVRGTQEVRAAVIASTLTSIAVFFPMIFVEGVAGQAFGDLGLAVVVSLLASLAVAVYFIPMLASREKIETIASDGSVDWMHFNSIRGLKEAWSGSRLWKKLIILPPLYWILRFVMLFLMEFIGKLGLVVFIGTVWFVTKPVKVVVGGLLGALLYVPVRGGAFIFKGLPNAYRKFLGWSLRQPGAVAMGAILVVAVTAWVATNLQSELLPEVKQGEFTVEAQLPVGTPLEETDSVMSLIEKRLQDKKSLESLLVSVGYDPVQSQRSDEGEHTTAFKVLVDEAANEAQLVKDVRAEFQGIPDLQSRVVKPVLFSSKTPIEVEIHAEDLVLLKKLTDEATQALSEMDELADVSSTLQRGAPEIQVIYDRERLSRYGLNIQSVARLVRDKVQGFEATRFNLLDRTIPVVVRLEEPDRRSVSDVRDMIVNPGGERPVPLSAVANIQLGEAPSEIRRSDGKRVGLIRANLASGSLSEAVAGIERTLQSSVNFPMSTTYFVSGQNEEWERSKGSLYLALGLSVFLVYVIMAIQFESLLHPLIIMVTIPLAFVGTIFLLWLTQTPVSVVVFLGMIMLAGIVVNNAIVLVDYINQLRRRGLPREEAIITAGSVRLRPILMTTATTVLGLTPMALGFGDGAEIRTPMALAVISGLIVSTVLTLIVIPTVYSVADRVVSKLFRRPADVVEGEFQPVETQS
ncbi:MAG: efflux RND transporter permease subunit, partial [Candidatus Eisenbacteria bacterium]|nr:efflux RND transporter permease subunit [Candidatus Eisenbacteria bacterium]